MQKIVQSRVGEDGTCFRAAMASILNLREQDVPDWPQSNQDSGVNPWLQRRGLKYSEVPASDPAPIGLHLALGTSPRGGQHAVIMRDGALVHDPHPPDGTGRGLVDVSYWGVLTPVAKDAVSLSPDRDGEMQLSYTALDAAIRGKELSAAAAALKAKHDELWHQPTRAIVGGQAAYAAMSRPVIELLHEAEVLLRNTRIGNKAVWVAKLKTGTELLARAKADAAKGDYESAAYRADAALSAAHYVIDALRALARRTGAKDMQDNYVYAEAYELKVGGYRGVALEKQTGEKKRGEVRQTLEEAKNDAKRFAGELLKGRAYKSGTYPSSKSRWRNNYWFAMEAAKDTLPAPVPHYKPGGTITLKNGKRATVTKVLPAKNLFGEKEFHVSTKTGEVLPVMVRGKVNDWKASQCTVGEVISVWAPGKKPFTAVVTDVGDKEVIVKPKYGGAYQRIPESMIGKTPAKAVDDLDLPEDLQPERHSAELLKANKEKRPFSIRRQGERQPSLFGQTFHGENIPKEAKDADATMAWQVWARGGSIGNKGPSLISEHPTREEASAKAKRMNKLLSPGEKAYYGLGYGIKEKGKAKDAAKTHKFEAPTASTEKFLKCCFCGKTEFNGLHKTGSYSATRAGMLQRDLDQMKMRAFQRERERAKATDRTRMHRALDRALDVGRCPDERTTRHGD